MTSRHDLGGCRQSETADLSATTLGRPASSEITPGGPETPPCPLPSAKPDRSELRRPCTRFGSYPCWRLLPFAGQLTIAPADGTDVKLTLERRVLTPSTCCAIRVTAS